MSGRRRTQGTTHRLLAHRENGCFCVVHLAPFTRMRIRARILFLECGFLELPELPIQSIGKQHRLTSVVSDPLRDKM